MMFTREDLKRHQAKDIIPFSQARKRVAWQAMNDHVANKFYNACVKPSGPEILWDIVDVIEMVHGIKFTKEELVPRSVYNMDMLRGKLSKAEAGGEMGDYDHQLLSQSFEKVRRIFRVGKLKPIPLEEVPYDGTKSAGLPTLRTKAEDYPRAIREARRLLKGKGAPAPITVFHRGKDLVDARPVKGFPFAVTLIEGMFFYPYQSALVQHHTVYSGGRYDYETAGLLNEIQVKSERILELDYSTFGQTIPKVLTSLAFKVIEENFEMTEEQRIGWELIKCYFHTAPELLPDGYIYYGRRHGVPDGTSFTQIVDSIVNAIALEYCARRLKFKLTRYQVLGDDSVSGVDRPVSLEKMGATLKELGITLNVKKSAQKVTSVAPHYLGHDWKAGKAVRDVRDTLIRLVTPERVRPEYHDVDGDVRRAAFIERIRNYQDDNPDAWWILEALVLFYQTDSGRRKFWATIWKHTGRWRMPVTYHYYNQFYGSLGLEWNELSRWKREKRMMRRGLHRGQAVFF